VKLLRLVLLLACLASLTAASLERRPLRPDDYARFKSLSDLQVSPDGNWVAYLLTSADFDDDELHAAVWLTSWTGTESLQLTRGASASDPRFSPDGRYVSFLSARSADAKTQVWLLDLRGGEARQLSHVTGDISRYEWAPDGKRLVLVMRGGAETRTEASDNLAKAPKPIVVEKWVFKVDGEGYRTADSHGRLYLLELETGEVHALSTDGTDDEDTPAWSPDGQQIAYVSNHLPDSDRTGLDELYVVASRPGATPRQVLSTFTPNHRHVLWSPDGRSLAFTRGEEPRYSSYIADRLALADLHTGATRGLTDRLDRAASAPVFSADGASIAFTVEDDGVEYPARVLLESGQIERLVAGTAVVLGQAAAAGHFAVLASGDTTAPEVYALESGTLRRLTSHNDALFAELQLGTVEDIRFRSRDGTEIHGQWVKPPGFVRGRRYPTIVWLHGGPVGQDDHSLPVEPYSPQLERQLFATNGYLALAVNYRGSTTRGAKFARAIAADWGHKDLEDVLAAVDYAVAQGLADPDRLAIGGWSYGAILTDYAIARDRRFKAAISGGGTGNELAMWGADQYALETTAELEPPWRNLERWLRLSYPFLHADRIHTPTLFLGGEKDFNVPIAGGEQMYQALRTLGVPTQLVIYPGQFHEPARPSYLQDRAERYLAWMTKYLATRP